MTNDGGLEIVYIVLCFWFLDFLRGLDCISKSVQFGGKKTSVFSSLF